MAGLLVGAELLSFEGLAPSGNASRQFIIPKAKLLKHFEESGNESMLREAWLVPDVCREPAGIWLGLCRTGTEGTLVYAGIPSKEFAKSHGYEVEFRHGLTFLT